MIHDYLETYTRGIVIIGDFNPTQLQPYWLSGKNLIRESEAANANIQIIHKDLVRYEVDWFLLEAKRDRIEIKTQKEPYFEALKDLALSLCKLLRVTEVRALGLNHLKLFALPDKDRYYEFGNKIAPLSNWQNSIMKEPRLLSTEIIDLNRYDNFKGLSRIRIRHADADKNLAYGVVIDFNDHFTINGMQDAENILLSEWNNTASNATKIMEDLWDKLNI